MIMQKNYINYSFLCILLSCHFSYIPNSYAEEGLQRLFTTREQRQKLDSLRFIPNLHTNEIDSSPTSLPKLPTKIKFNGLIKRSDGKSIVWVNGRKHLFRQGFVVHLDKLDALQLPITLSHPNQLINIKPGQVINTNKGKLEEGYHQ